MAEMHRSVATIDSPEFVNITQMNNPLISKCEVKVLYVGENRNRSFISKEVATQMAQTLPGCPIVGYYIDSKDDFGDHGDQVIIDGEGVKFNKLTKPYGFVAPDAKIWFQKFEDTDDFGQKIVREYLMTEGYLWTGQFEEAKRVITQGNPQSMELDEETLKGYWSTDYNRGIDFFIINDAVFSKLCILGEDVEPCFEGASVTSPNVSSQFSKDDNFAKSLSTMMTELKFALQKEGEFSMENQENVTPVVEATENFSAETDNVVEAVSVETENITEEFAKNEEKKEEEKPAEKKEAPAEKEEDPEKKESDSESEQKEEKPAEEDKEEEDDEKKEKAAAKNSLHSDEEYAALEAKYNELQTEFASLEEENKKLVAFKQEVEDKQKDDMIASFYMLSDEDKQDVVTNKAQYSLEDIEAKLSVICVRKKVNFDLDNTSEQTNENTAPITYNLDSHQADSLPAWLRAVEDVRNRNK